MKTDILKKAIGFWVASSSPFQQCNIRTSLVNFTPSLLQDYSLLAVAQALIIPPKPISFIGKINKALYFVFSSPYSEHKPVWMFKVVNAANLTGIPSLTQGGFLCLPRFVGVCNFVFQHLLKV